ncbi:MAG: hypothetical protein IT204_15960 [Fimbriimonadaceae bacterium]|nr:hypothetical protein [Fimbriimonadaceae bacterium]
MRTGTWPALQVAWRRLHEASGLCAAALLVEVPLLLLALALLRLPGGELSALERQRAWAVAGGGLAALGAVWWLQRAAWLAVADGWLCGRRPHVAAWSAAGPAALRLAVVQGALLAGNLLLLGLAYLLFLALLCGSDFSRLGSVTVGGARAVVAVWAERGWVWLLGQGLLLTAVATARQLLELASRFGAAALLSGGPGVWPALGGAVRLASSHGWLLLGRGLSHLLLWLLWLGALQAVGGLAETVTVLLTRQPPPGAVSAAWWLLAALTAVLLRAWLGLSDLVLFRTLAAGQDPRLAVVGVRLPRPARPGPPADGSLRPASEPPGERWQPDRLASEP